MAVGAVTRKAQYGREATAGTAVPATGIWRGMASITDTRVFERVEEDVGIRGGYGRIEIVALGAQVDMSSQAATFEQLPHIFEAGIETVTPTGTGPYTYTYVVGPTGTPSIKSYTWEAGDANEAEEVEYCFVESFELSGSYNEVVNVAAVWRGRQVTPTTFTAALTPIDVNSILFNTGTLFIDDSGGTIGTTQVSNSFRSFSLSMETGLVAVTTGEGDLYFTFHKLTDPVISLEITAEHDTSWDSNGEKAAWRSKDVRLVRINFTSGTDVLEIDMAGKWETFGTIEEQDGNSVLRGTLFAHYSSDDTLFASFEVINDIATL